MNYSAIYAKKIALFYGIDKADLEKMLTCLGATVAAYHKGEYILMAGEKTHHVGILLSGSATIYKDDVLGSRSVIATLGPADMFAETFVCAGLQQSSVTVQATADASVLKLSFNKIVQTCPSACAFHATLIRNMIGILARKNLALGKKIDHIGKKTTRQKLASYLLSQSAASGSHTFVISLDRQALAEYLCVNRSALSRELSRIRNDGILEFNKNRFTIRDKNGLEDILLSE